MIIAYSKNYKKKHHLTSLAVLIKQVGKGKKPVVVIDMVSKGEELNDEDLFLVMDDTNTVISKKELNGFATQYLCVKDLHDLLDSICLGYY